MITSHLDMTKPLIFEISEVMNDAECVEWIDRIRAAGPEPATINTVRGSLVDSQIRSNRRVIFDDPESATDLFDRLRKNVPQEIHGMSLVGINERLRCYEYLPGQRFAPHSDGAFYRDDLEQSWYTCIIYLNEDFEGGETIFFVEPEVVIRPRTGAGLFFSIPSFTKERW